MQLLSSESSKSPMHIIYVHKKTHYREQAEKEFQISALHIEQDQTSL